MSLAACRRIEQAHETLEHAFVDTAAISPAWWEPELLRVRGELLLMDGRGGAAASAMCSFEDSLALARARGARWWASQAQGCLERLRSSRTEPA